MCLNRTVIAHLILFIIAAVMTVISCNESPPQEKDSVLGTVEGNHFELATELRRLVADTLDEGSLTHALCEGFVEVDFDSFDSNLYLRMFAMDSCRATCGLAANIMVEMLDEKGVRSVAYNFGFEGTALTHVLVIANTAPHIWTVHDPFFNYSVADANGEPKDFFVLLDELSRNEFGGIRVSQDTVWRTVLIDPSLDYEIRDVCIEHLVRTTQSIEEHKFRRPVCFDCRIGGADCPELDFISRMESRLEAEGYLPYFLMALLKPINKVWGPDAESFQAMVDSTFSELAVASAISNLPSSGGGEHRRTRSYGYSALLTYFQWQQ